jgi:hypothetical protein
MRCAIDFLARELRRLGAGTDALAVQGDTLGACEGGTVSPGRVGLAVMCWELGLTRLLCRETHWEPAKAALFPQAAWDSL